MYLLCTASAKQIVKCQSKLLILRPPCLKFCNHVILIPYSNVELLFYWTACTVCQWQCKQLLLLAVLVFTCKLQPALMMVSFGERERIIYRVPAGTQSKSAYNSHARDLSWLQPFLSLSPLNTLPYCEWRSPVDKVAGLGCIDCTSTFPWADTLTILQSLHRVSSCLHRAPWQTYTHAGFHIGFWVGEGKDDGSRMIVACVSMLGGSGGMPPPQENYEFRSSQIASDAVWDKTFRTTFWWHIVMSSNL